MVYKSFMPNQRAKDQTLIAFALKADLLNGLDAGREKTEQNRSDFIRDAIANEVTRLGIPLAKKSARMPDRVKGPRYPDHAPQSAALNEEHPKAATKASAGKGKK